MQPAMDPRRIVGHLFLVADGTIHLLFYGRAGAIRCNRYSGMTLRAGDYLPPMNRRAELLSPHKKGTAFISGPHFLFAMAG
jgi:hypothetical protein